MLYLYTSSEGSAFLFLPIIINVARLFVVLCNYSGIIILLVVIYCIFICMFAKGCIILQNVLG